MLVRRLLLTSAFLTLLVAPVGLENPPAQAQGRCSYSISSTTRAFPAIGGSGVVSVEAGAGCRWTASVTGEWITVTRGGTGLGNGTVEFSVAQNVGDQRTGTIDVEGQSVSVAQAAGAGSRPQPLISLNGAVNAASFVPGLVPGSLASVFGFNFSQGISGTVLPGGRTSFRGISVSIGGVLAPLLSLSNVDGHEQINLQVPFELTSGTTWVEVNNNGIRGRRDDIPVFDAQPGIFEIPLGPEGSPMGAVIHQTES